MHEAGYNVDNKDKISAVKTIIIFSEMNNFKEDNIRKYTSGAKSYGYPII